MINVMVAECECGVGVGDGGGGGRVAHTGTLVVKVHPRGILSSGTRYTVTSGPV